MLAHTPELLPLAVGILVRSSKEPHCWGSPRLPGAYQFSVLLLQGPQVFSPRDPGLGGTWMPPYAASAHREGSRHLCTAWPCLGTISCIFFYFLTEWALHTLTQDLALGGVGGADGVSLLSPEETQLPEPSPACTGPPGPSARPSSPIEGRRFTFCLIYPLLPSALWAGLGLCCWCCGVAVLLVWSRPVPAAKTHLCSGVSRRLASSPCSDTPQAGLAGCRFA